MQRISRIITLGTGVLGLVCGSVHAAEVGTAFTYQGELVRDGTPVNGECDFEFTLWDASAAGTQIGPTLTFDRGGGNPPPVTITNGVFTVVLDFGEDVFDGNGRWLKIQAACPSGEALLPLDPRQAVRPVPYALALPALRTQQTPDPDPSGCPNVSSFGPNVIGGWHGNSVAEDIVGATISGGGGVICFPGTLVVHSA